MLTATLLKYSASGRVLTAIGAVPTDFNGGTPTSAEGYLCGSEDDPTQFTAGFGYMDSGAICARDSLPNFFDGGLAMTGVGSLALALLDPITGYIAGLPVTEDGRLAVELVGPPPLGPFSSGFSEGFA